MTSASKLFHILLGWNALDLGFHKELHWYMEVLIGPDIFVSFTTPTSLTQAMILMHLDDLCKFWLHMRFVQIMLRHMNYD